MSPNPFQNLGKNIIYASIAAVTSVVIVKSIVRRRREAKFTPSAMVNSRSGENQAMGYYDNVALVKPGFPLPQDQKSDERKRKSEYEGSGMSVMSRKRGDKLGFIDRKKDE